MIYTSFVHMEHERCNGLAVQQPTPKFLSCFNAYVNTLNVFSKKRGNNASSPRVRTNEKIYASIR
ncbi:hypothetical protein EJ08DRAFT_648160 [Tothia fuscella]|uniref:Uncharacterized protein n=1 Tax=Tothia fuscella TaxID=1048955 RepID=A0A9P4U0W9_9PEZI|nr:hypothetical protein EJ08DRAFT_648160 [Tothia fuscella]